MPLTVVWEFTNIGLISTHDAYFETAVCWCRRGSWFCPFALESCPAMPTISLFLQLAGTEEGIRTGGCYQEEQGEKRSELEHVLRAVDVSEGFRFYGRVECCRPLLCHSFILLTATS